MPQRSRSRQRAAIAALLATVPGIDVTYDYELDPDSPELEGKTYAICGGAPSSLMKNIAGNGAAPYMDQSKGWGILVGMWSRALLSKNNKGRQTATKNFDAILDAVEQTLFMASKLTDGSGTVAEAFGFQIQTIEVAPEFGSDRTLLVGVFIVTGRVFQTA